MAIIEGGTSNQLQEVDPISLASRNTLYDKSGNRISKKQREAIPATQEALLIAGKNDDIATILRTDRKGNLLTGNYIPELIENFEGSIINTNKWLYQNLTIAATQATLTGIIMNTSAVTTASSYSIITSKKYFSKLPKVPLQFKSRLRANCFTNSVIDFGFGIATTTTLITPNGVSVRVVNGLWSVALTSNSLELTTANINDYLTGSNQLNTANSNAEFYVVDIMLDDDNIVVTVQNTQTGILVGYATLAVPFSALKMFQANALPCYYRVYNTAVSPATFPNLTIAECQVLSLDWNISLTQSELSGRLGYTAEKNPQNSNFLSNKTNSAAPSALTLSNTTATLAATVKDGQFTFAAPVGAETDFIIIAYQVPANSRFMVTGVKIDTINAGAIVATTATVLEWFFDLNSTAVSFATAGSRVVVGVQSYAVGAGIGVSAPSIDFNIDPIPVEQLQYLKLGVRVPIGTATASQVIRGNVFIKGYFVY